MWTFNDPSNADMACQALSNLHGISKDLKGSFKELREHARSPEELSRGRKFAKMDSMQVPKGSRWIENVVSLFKERLRIYL